MKKKSYDDTPYMDIYSKTAKPAGYRFPGAPYILKAGTAPGVILPPVPAEEPKKGKKEKK